MALFSGLTPAICDAVRPVEPVRAVDWAAQHIVLPPGSEIQGPFRPDLFPHMIEPLDCCDDPYYEQITIEAASRMGKTATSLAFLAKTAATDPHPMAFGDADERSTKRVLKRLWRTLELSDAFRGKIPPPVRRDSTRVSLPDCEIEGAWSGSPATAADYAAFVIALNEVDKYSRDASAEASFLNLMAERAKGFRDPTIIWISTPSLKDHSSIRAARLAGDNRSRFVPCPHCNHFQTLRRGDGQAPGGLRWAKDKHGKSSPQLALEDSWYECEKCRFKIRDHHRHAMLNAGLYVAEGQEINRGRVVGKKAREGRHASFGPLPTLYSLLPSIDWGTIASKYLKALGESRKGDREAIRNYINSWDSEVFDPRRKKVEVHELTERLGTQDPQRVCPPWAVFLTRMIDVGGEGNEFYWQVCAWGAHARGAVIDYGTIAGPTAQAELEQLIAGGELAPNARGAFYPHADGGIPLFISRTGIDSGDGHHTETVYMICEKLKRFGVVPTKGLRDAAGTFPEMIRPSVLGGDAKQTSKLKAAASGFGSTGSLVLFHINHGRTQDWIQDIVHGDVLQDAPHAFTLCQSAAQDGSFCAQLLAEYLNPQTGKWDRTGPNEMRDCCRGNRALASLLTKNDATWATQLRIPVAVTATQQRRRGLTTPDGRPYFVLNRQG